MQYFGNLFALFFKLLQKQSSIQSRGVMHHLKPTFCQFFDPTLIPILHRSFHLFLVFETFANTRRESWIRASNNARELGPNYVYFFKYLETISGHSNGHEVLCSLAVNQCQIFLSQIFLAWTCSSCSEYRLASIVQLFRTTCRKLSPLNSIRHRASPCV